MSAEMSPRNQGHTKPVCRRTTSIVHVIDSLHVGGAQTHLVTMLREATESYEATHRVLSLFGDGPIGDEIRSLGIPVDGLDLGPLMDRPLTAGRQLAHHFARMRPQIVEAHLTWSRLLGLYGAWRAGVPQRIGFEQGDVYLHSAKFRAANFAGQHFAQRIVVCSQALADWNRRVHHVAARRLVVMHNCVDPDRFTPATAMTRAAPPFAPPLGATRFCAAGTLGEGVNKRMDVCIRAIHAARLRGADVGLIICGDGPQRASLETLAGELGVGDAVRFLGMRHDVPAVMAGCDAFCHAAVWEPFGIVAVEAMATALPVIVPDAGGIVEAVDDGTTGLIYPVLDHESLAGRMIQLHRDPALRERMGQAGRRAAEGRFSVQSYVRRLYGLYGVAPCQVTAA